MKFERKKVMILSIGTLVLVSVVLLSDIRSNANIEKDFLVEEVENAKKLIQTLQEKMKDKDTEIEELEVELQNVQREEQDVSTEIKEIEKIIYKEIESNDNTRLEEELRVLREIQVQLRKDSETLGKQVLEKSNKIVELEKEVVQLEEQLRDSYTKEDVRKMLFLMEKELLSIIELGTPLTQEELEKIIK